VGLFHPVAFPQQTEVFGLSIAGTQIWIFLLSAYVLVAAGLPVWIFLQSRDFINVHILYVGMAVLLVTLLVGGIRGGPIDEPIDAVNIQQGTEALGPFWPGMFIVIACGAVSGFHSLCAGGTTCKQLTSEPAARRIGYNGMLLESFLAVCVIAVLMLGAGKMNYIADVHPDLLSPGAKSNAVLGFAMSLGNAGKLAFGVPIAVGALAGMVLLEGFLVTTLDTAIRLTRYLIEEVWRTFFARYDVYATPVAAKETQDWGRGDAAPVGAEGLPIAPPGAASETEPAFPTATRGPLRALLKLTRQYWFNSGLAVALTLAFALSGGQRALWGIFATSNQLLAAMVLALAALWLVRNGRRFWFALIPAAFMLATTCANLILLMRKYSAEGTKNSTLLAADVLVMLITIYLLIAGVRHTVGLIRRRGGGQGPEGRGGA